MQLEIGDATDQVCRRRGRAGDRGMHVGCPHNPGSNVNTESRGDTIGSIANRDAVAGNHGAGKYSDSDGSGTAAGGTPIPLGG
jgi:hypothetical protein